MDRSYWENALTRRVLSRRKAMAMAGAGVSAAAILAACGSSSSSSSSSASSSASSSGSSSSSSSSGASALPANAKEATYSPSKGTFTPGGTYHLTYGIENFNPVTQWTEGTQMSGIYVYDRPLTSREDSRRYVLEAMQSIETPDPLTVVMKLRPGMKSPQHRAGQRPRGHR